jgi:hypothetical protein
MTIQYSPAYKTSVRANLLGFPKEIDIEKLLDMFEIAIETTTTTNREYIDELYRKYSDSLYDYGYFL